MVKWVEKGCPPFGIALGKKVGNRQCEILFGSRLLLISFCKINTQHYEGSFTPNVLCVIFLCYFFCPSSVLCCYMCSSSTSTPNRNFRFQRIDNKWVACVLRSGLRERWVIHLEIWILHITPVMFRSLFPMVGSTRVFWNYRAWVPELVLIWSQPDIAPILWCLYGNCSKLYTVYPR